MVPGDNGSTTILWYDRIDKNTANIYVKKINAAGVAEWTATQFAIFNPIQTPFPPQIISDGAGGVIIAWSDYRSGHSLDIVAQQINAAGQPMWTANGVLLCAASGDQEIASVIPDGKGGAIIAWTDYRSGSDPDIYVQQINVSGTTQWTTNGVAVAAEPGFQSGAVLLLNAAGNTIITWEDGRNGVLNIYAQMINANGEAKWTTGGVVICPSSTLQYRPSIVSDGGQDAIIAWSDYGRNSEVDFYAQKISSAGTVEWDINGIEIARTGRRQRAPQMVSDNTGGAIFTWDDFRTDDDAPDIYAQRVDKNGLIEWPVNGVAICTAAKWQSSSTIAPDGAGGAIISWQDNRGNDRDIYVQRINATGMPQWIENGVLIGSAKNDQAFPAIASFAGKGAVITWIDYRNSDGSDSIRPVYAQNVNLNGVLGCFTPVITDQPLINQTVSQGAIPTALMVSATGDLLNYQWYSNTTTSTTGAINLYPAGTDTAFTPPTAKEGTVYYYCRVTGNCDTFYSDFAQVTVIVPITRLEVTVSPNPTESFFNVAVKSPGNQALDIRMFDMLGRLVELQHGLPGQTFKFGERVAAAMYIIEVRQGDQTVITKAVKQ